MKAIQYSLNIWYSRITENLAITGPSSVLNHLIVILNCLNHLTACGKFLLFYGVHYPHHSQNDPLQHKSDHITPLSEDFLPQKIK